MNPNNTYPENSQYPAANRISSTNDAKTLNTGKHETSKHKKNNSSLEQTGLSAVQQQFVLKFCRQLASVIQACEQSESAEIEVGRRLVGKHKVRVKLRSERES